MQHEMNICRRIAAMDGRGCAVDARGDMRELVTAAKKLLRTCVCVCDRAAVSRPRAGHGRLVDRHIGKIP